MKIKTSPPLATPRQALEAIARQLAMKTDSHLVCTRCNAWAPLGPNRKGDAMTLPHAATCPLTILDGAIPDPARKES